MKLHRKRLLLFIFVFCFSGRSWVDARPERRDFGRRGRRGRPAFPQKLKPPEKLGSRRGRAPPFHGPPPAGCELASVDIENKRSDRRVTYEFCSKTNTHLFTANPGFLFEALTEGPVALWRSRGGKFADRISVTEGSGGKRAIKIYVPTEDSDGSDSESEFARSQLEFVEQPYRRGSRRFGPFEDLGGYGRSARYDTADDFRGSGADRALVPLSGPRASTPDRLISVDVSQLRSTRELTHRWDASEQADVLAPRPGFAIQRVTKGSHLVWQHEGGPHPASVLVIRDDAGKSRARLKYADDGPASGRSDRAHDRDYDKHSLKDHGKRSLTEHDQYGDKRSLTDYDKHSLTEHDQYGDKHSLKDYDKHALKEHDKNKLPFGDNFRYSERGYMEYTYWDPEKHTESHYYEYTYPRPDKQGEGRPDSLENRRSAAIEAEGGEHSHAVKAHRTHSDSRAYDRGSDKHAVKEYDRHSDSHAERAHSASRTHPTHSDHKHSEYRRRRRRHSASRHSGDSVHELGDYKVPIDLTIDFRWNSFLFDYSKLNNVGIYSPKPGYGFRKVKLFKGYYPPASDCILWEARRPEEYANLVQVFGDSEIALFLDSGAQKLFRKSQGQWVESEGASRLYGGALSPVDRLLGGNFGGFDDPLTGYLGYDSKWPPKWDSKWPPKWLTKTDDTDYTPVALDIGSKQSTRACRVSRRDAEGHVEFVFTPGGARRFSSVADGADAVWVSQGGRQCARRVSLLVFARAGCRQLFVHLADGSHLVFFSFAPAPFRMVKALEAD